jgi:hypothetical protein
MPAWDTQRIVAARWDHLDWMHAHFADEVLLAGEDSETDQEAPASRFPDLEEEHR